MLILLTARSSDCRSSWSAVRRSCSQ